ncbi:MAG: hypothetical protein KC897_01680 [Candidatus Omnitrophica bacterium]|nr:hypothetical protein [Candidatus Omnitrophota bacterium]MCB9721971.1 hypothetical protein [Candidatus Omnitrophota bacterium]
MSQQAHFRNILIILALVCGVTGFMRSAADAGEEISWPVQETGVTTAPEAVNTPPPANPVPAARLTLEGCLEAVRSKKGKIHDDMPEVQNCYKQWANTLGSNVGTYSVIRSKPGPGPCHNRQVVTISDKGPMTVEIVANPAKPECAAQVLEPLRKFEFSLVNQEYFRSLLEMDMLKGFPEQLVDPARDPVTAVKWTFIVNSRPVKSITINQDGGTALPAQLNTYLNSVNAVILQTMSSR